MKVKKTESRGISGIASEPRRRWLAGGIRVEKAVTIHRPILEVYSYWRASENWHNFMRNLEDAAVIEDIPNEMISWRSLERAGIDSAGSVHFKEAPGHRGTEVRGILFYDPPGGRQGEIFAKIFGKDPAKQLLEDLRRFKNILEAGEIPRAV